MGCKTVGSAPWRYGWEGLYQWCHVGSTVLFPDDLVGRVVSSVVSWRAMRESLDPFLEELTGYSLFERKIAIFAETGRGSAGKGRDFVLMLWPRKGQAEGNGRPLLSKLFAYK